MASGFGKVLVQVTEQTLHVESEVTQQEHPALRHGHLAAGTGSVPTLILQGSNSGIFISLSGIAVSEADTSSQLLLSSETTAP